MRILSFHIDNFGLFSNAEAKELSPGLSIFLGQNEAGKSTCLEFLRAMLMGFPEKDNKSAWRKIKPLNGGIASGSLLLAQPRKNGQEREFSISRNADGFLSINEINGAPLPANWLAKNFSGITKAVYANLFGFSLEELETLDTLDEEEIRQVLYGASFGCGKNAPAPIIDNFQEQKKKIFLPGEHPQKLNLALRKLEKLKREISDARENIASYNNLRFDLENRSKQLEDLRQVKKQKEEQRRQLEKRLNLWIQFQEWNEIQRKLNSFQPFPGKMPEDAPARLARLEEARDAVERAVVGKKHKLEQLRNKRDALNPDGKLLSALPLLQELSENKGSYRQAVNARQPLEESLDREKLELERNLAKLGPDWSCERIRATDRSLFSREDLEKKAATMTSAQASWQAARDNLTRFNREVEKGQNEVAELKDNLESLPRIQAALNESEREELRQSMARLDESTRLGPTRRAALENAITSFKRALKIAQIAFAPDAELSEASEDQALASKLDHILKKQPEAEKAAEEVKLVMEKARSAKEALIKNEEAINLQKQKIESAREAWQAISGPGREELENRVKNLRSLRSISTNIENEKERLAELDKRITSEQAHKSGKNWGLPIFSIIFLLIGGAIFIANRFFGISEIDFGSGLILPLNLWAAYVVLACGVILLAVGLPGNRQEEKKRKQELLQLQSRRETSSMHLAELGAQAQRLCQETGVESMDPITLDATEMLLEREKEQCFQEERSRKDLKDMDAELMALQATHAELNSKASELENATQQARRDWHSLMQGVNPDFVPLPESANIFFARAESAKLALTNVINARKELDALWEDLHLIEQNITSLPVIANKLENAEEPLSLTDAAKQILADCGQADALQEKRKHFEENIKRQQEKLDELRREQANASDRLEKCEKRLSESRKEWNDALASLGFENALTPETVKEAFKLMEHCLKTEERVSRIEHEISLNIAEMDAMRNPLQQIISSLDKTPVTDNQGKTNWLATLEELTGSAMTEQNLLREKEALINQIDETETELGKDETELSAANAKIKDLLIQAGAVDANDFLRLHKLFTEKTALEEKKANLENIFGTASQDQPLERFIETFEHETQAEHEEKITLLNTEIDQLTDRNMEEAKIVGELTARAQKLAKDDNLGQLRQEEAILKESIDRMTMQWAVLAVAEKLLIEAKNRFEKDRQPEIIKNASRIFANITAGNWKGLGLSLDDTGIMAIPPSGLPISPGFLSRGAREQAYLALRLAYIEAHAKESGSLPVIMDEILVNFDPERTERTARTITNFCKNPETEQQIIYFTCQPAIVDLLKRNDPNATLFILKDRKISRVS